jgi:secreted PhoX family phosphatase
MAQIRTDATTQHRRAFLKQSAAVVLAFGGLAQAGRTLGSGGEALRLDRHGPLRPDPLGILDLPEGFEYRVIARVGERMADGLFVPGLPDGMAAFPGPGGSTLVVCNHELSYGSTESPFRGGVPAAVRPKIWDGGSGRPLPGGTTTIQYDTRSGEVIGQHLSLAGTERNCAGGPTPRNSWITCEETVARASPGEREWDHGYCFEVPAQAMELPYDAASALIDPVPIRGMGRFNHEACATSPTTGFVYLTEDRHDGLIYRYKPRDPDRLAEGGALQALVVVDRPSLDTRNWLESGATIEVGDRFAIEWLDMDNVEAPEDDLRLRGFAAGAARFARGEGMWLGVSDHEGIDVPTVFFACTNGGRAEAGQLWKLHLPGDDSERSDRSGVLELFVEPNDRSVLENADNIAQAPNGDLYVCEDGRDDQFVLAVSPNGSVSKFARNATGTSELAGVCFSPDGSTMFVNIQTKGLTLAVSGPF